MILRPYQQEAVEAIWNEFHQSNTCLIVLPTGTGKTEVIIGLVKKATNAMDGFKCIFLVNKITLLEQTVNRFRKHFGDNMVGHFQGSTKQIGFPITVATIQSIHKKHIEQFNLLILDESHNINQEDGTYKKFIEKQLERYPRLKVLAVTATPFRSDGYIYGEKKLFNHITYKKDLIWAQENGYLCKVRFKHSPERFDTSKLKIRMGDYVQEELNKLTEDQDKIKVQLLDALPQLENRKKIVWACTSIKHAEMLQEQINKIEPCGIIHYKSEDDEWLNLFKESKLRHLVFISIISEGFDFPPIDAVVLMRPTRSPILYVQIVGRGLRPSPITGKEDCLVLDYGGVIENLGPLHNPKVSIKDSTKKKGVVEINMKFCPQCYEYVEPQVEYCPCCQFSFIKEVKKDLLKNLDLRSYGANDNYEDEVQIFSIMVLEHKSKNGNDCIKINYYLEGGRITLISEYFTLGMAFSEDKLRRRLELFNIKTVKKETIGTKLTCDNLFLFATISKNAKGFYEVTRIRFKEPFRD